MGTERGRLDARRNGKFFRRVGLNLGRRGSLPIKAGQAAGRLLLAVVKAVLIWAATQAAKDFFKRSTKGLTIPLWLVFAAITFDKLWLFLTIWLIVQVAAISIQKWIGGQIEIPDPNRLE